MTDNGQENLAGVPPKEGAAPKVPTYHVAGVGNVDYPTLGRLIQFNERLGTQVRGAAPDIYTQAIGFSPRDPDEDLGKMNTLLLRETRIPVDTIPAILRTDPNTLLKESPIVEVRNLGKLSLGTLRGICELNPTFAQELEESDPGIYHLITLPEFSPEEVEEDKAVEIAGVRISVSRLHQIVDDNPQFLQDHPELLRKHPELGRPQAEGRHREQAPTRRDQTTDHEEEQAETPKEMLILALAHPDEINPDEIGEIKRQLDLSDEQLVALLGDQAEKKLKSLLEDHPERIALLVKKDDRDLFNQAVEKIEDPLLIGQLFQQNKAIKKRAEEIMEPGYVKDRVVGYKKEIVKQFMGDEQPKYVEMTKETIGNDNFDTYVLAIADIENHDAAIVVEAAMALNIDKEGLAIFLDDIDDEDKKSKILNDPVFKNFKKKDYSQELSEFTQNQQDAVSKVKETGEKVKALLQAAKSDNPPADLPKQLQDLEKELAERQGKVDLEERDLGGNETKRRQFRKIIAYTFMALIISYIALLRMYAGAFGGGKGGRR